MPTLLPLLVLAVAAPAAAQVPLQQALGQAQLSVKGFQPAGPTLPDDQKALDVANKARALMEAEGGRGLRLMQALADGKVLFDIETPRDMSRLCELGRREVWPGDFQPIVRCDPALAKVSPRYAALLLAEESAKFLWRELPACAEKDFIVDSLMTRAWLEVGGERAKLPSFDGRTDAPRAARIQRWLKLKLRDAVLDAKANGRTTLDSLLEANAAAQGAGLKRLADLKEDLGRATCESDERALMAEIDAQNKALGALRADEEKLKGFKNLAKAFAVEEDDWAKANWRRLSAAPPR